MTKNTVIQIRCNDKLKEDFIRVVGLLGKTTSQAFTEFMQQTVELEQDIKDDNPQSDQQNKPAKPAKKQSKAPTPPKQEQPVKQSENSSRANRMQKVNGKWVFV